jgi:hypothetical protein
MKRGVRLESSFCLAVSVVLCLTTLFYTAVHVSSPAHAIQETVTGSVSSSPSSGPVGATITVSGSGWPEPDGEQVSFGYIIAAYNCGIVSGSGSQAGTFHGGSFNGWFVWPNGIALGTYSICATFGSTTDTANTYTLLSASAPQVSIYPSILIAGKLATITGSNFFPAGTAVQLFWETLNGYIVLRINPTISKANSAILRTFTVPTTTLSSGSYKIVAIVGGGQPPTLSSSATFTFNAQTPTPTPTPGPDPTPTQQPSPTSTAPVITPTTASTTVTTGTTGNTTTTNLPNNILLIVGVAGSLVLLIAILAIVLLIRRKKARSKRMLEEVGPPVGPTTNGVLPWQNGLVGPGGMPSPMNNRSITPAPGWPTPSMYGGPMSLTPIGQAVQTYSGPAPLGGQSPQQMQYSPYVHLLQQPAEGSTGNMNDHTAIAPNDPTLEAMKKQVQMGLFVTSRQRQDDVSSS